MQPACHPVGRRRLRLSAPAPARTDVARFSAISLIKTVDSTKGAMQRGSHGGRAGSVVTGFYDRLPMTRAGGRRTDASLTHSLSRRRDVKCATAAASSIILVAYCV